ncbi:SNAP25 homologous protein SNAP33-like [Nymphaea colorata]|nr:SNAP25 homologous protein SNAP33-like [Nymphaea colorata]XP_031492544.1 SNAP25 homologous protein SNAP33-like [Nymphaea colorata]
MSRLGEDNKAKHFGYDSENHATNPFDSDSDSEAAATTPVKPLGSSTKPFVEVSSKNPFGDEDTTPAKKEPFGQASGDKKSSSMNRHTEDENDSQANKSLSGSSLYRINSARFVAQVMEKAVSFGESAVKTAERLKEAGIVQSQRLMARNAAEEQKRQRDELFSVHKEKSAIAAASPAAVSSSPFSLWWASRSRYKNDSRDEGAFENQTVEDLENYSLCKSKETTETVNGCMKIAEEIREEATKTLVSLHHQGDQITRAHADAATIDYDLSRGEKLLGSLGGIFSKTWRPTKTRPISGPAIMAEDRTVKRTVHLEQKEQLGISHSPKRCSKAQQYSNSQTTVGERIEIENAKQDDALSDLSNLLGELKVMAIDMGSEIERQHKALDHFHSDVEELNYRVKGANVRSRRLLGK